MAVTGKIYGLQPHEGLLKLKKVDLKKSEVVIQSDSHKENEYGKYIWKRTKVYTAFLFIGHTFWKESSEDRVKLLESNILDLLLFKDNNG